MLKSYDNMGENVKNKLRKCGISVTIHPLAKITNPSSIEIGDFSQIDDFTFINGGKRIILGKYNHIASFVSIIGGGELITEDYVGIAAGARIITGTDHYGSGKRISPLVSDEERGYYAGKIILKKDVFIGSNVVIHPNVTINTGAIIGSNSLVLKDVEAWSINIGNPCKKIKNRPKLIIDK